MGSTRKQQQQPYLRNMSKDSPGVHVSADGWVGGGEQRAVSCSVHVPVTCLPHLLLTPAPQGATNSTEVQGLLMCLQLAGGGAAAVPR